MPLVACPSCDARLRMDEIVPGKTVRCPKCATRFQPDEPTTDSSPHITTSAGQARSRADDATPRRRPSRRSHAADEAELPHARLPGTGLAIALSILLLLMLGSGLVFVLFEMSLFVHIPVQGLRAEALLGKVMGAFFTPCVILFAIWFYRAHANLRLMHAEHMESTPAGSVVVLFIPVLWHWAYQSAQEIFKASHPSVYHGNWRNDQGSVLAMAWWCSWAAAIILLNLSRLVIWMAVSVGRSPSPGGVRFGAFLLALFFATALIGALFQLLFLRAVMRRQQQRFRRQCA